MSVFIIDECCVGPIFFLLITTKSRHALRWTRLVFTLRFYASFLIFNISAFCCIKYGFFLFSPFFCITLRVYIKLFHVIIIIIIVAYSYQCSSDWSCCIHRYLCLYSFCIGIYIKSSISLRKKIIYLYVKA